MDWTFKANKAGFGFVKGMTVFRIVTADVVCWNSCFTKQEQVG